MTQVLAEGDEEIIIDLPMPPGEPAAQGHLGLHDTDHLVVFVDQPDGADPDPLVRAGAARGPLVRAEKSSTCDECAP